MDPTTVDGFAAALMGENDDELRAFVESTIGLQLREFCDDAVAFSAKVTCGTPITIEEVSARADKDAERINGFLDMAGSAFIEQYPALGAQARELLRRRVRMVALQHVEGMILAARWQMRQSKAGGGVIVQ